MQTEYAYIGRDNAIDVQLEDDTVAPGTLANTDLSLCTKISILVDAADEYNSVDDPTIVSFTAGGIVTIKLGSVVTEPDVKHKVEIVMYDALNTNGISWQPKLTVKVVESEPQ